MKKASKRSTGRARDIAATYNDMKEFAGRRYTGMRVGRSHKWYYDKGVWKETKITPDQWQVDYAVTKRRAGKAPEGAGVPVGIEYHWYILADQNVTKLNANDYSTVLSGHKFKLAHKRAGQERWSAGVNAQRTQLIRILHNLIKELEQLRHADESAQSGAKKKAAPTRRNGKAKRGDLAA